MEGLDSTDLAILKILQQDASLTTKQIAEQINLSSTPVFERVKRLEKDGYVEKYIALVNKQKLGFNLIAFCNISLKEHSKSIGEQVVKDLSLLKEVSEIYNISGEFDFMLKVVVKDMPPIPGFHIEQTRFYSKHR